MFYIKKHHNPMSFEENIKQWVKLDNEIKKHNDYLKDLREQKSSLQDKIQLYIENNDLEQATIQISDGKLKFATLKQQTPLSLKFVKECLQEIISSSEQVDTIIDHIKSSRNYKLIKDIKRSYSK